MKDKLKGWADVVCIAGGYQKYQPAQNFSQIVAIIFWQLFFTNCGNCGNHFGVIYLSHRSFKQTHPISTKANVLIEGSVGLKNTIHHFKSKNNTKKNHRLLKFV